MTSVDEAILRHNELTLSQNEGQNHVLQVGTLVKLSHIETMKKVESKRWGPKMKILIYYALKTCFDEETLPSEFTETRLQALYKRKGSRKDLNNYRFLHLRSMLAKLFEYIIMMKVKDTMYNSFPEAQIGGKPNCRTMEHMSR